MGYIEIWLNISHFALKRRLVLLSLRHQAEEVRAAGSSRSSQSIPLRIRGSRQPFSSETFCFHLHSLRMEYTVCRIFCSSFLP